jgi:peptidoglycan hydrolase-like amidase
VPLLLALLVFVSFISAAQSSGQDVKIGVLGLFHPREIILSTTLDESLVVSAANKTFEIEPGAHSDTARIDIAGDNLILNFRGQEIRAAEIRASSRNHGAVIFRISVPGKMNRQYRGTLVVKASSGEVVPIVTMDLETAVASVVAAESEPGTEIESLKAQAIVTRSYFVAGKGRHHSFDFCDLTHCQFLRDPPSATSDVSNAVAATRGMILQFEGKPIATMFTRSCGGKTRTPEELKMTEGSYPYFSVICDYCRKNPIRWTRRVSAQDAALLLKKGEAGRLAVNRRLGWNTVPSNNFMTREVNGEVQLDGVGQGHGIGLCQRGARAMADEGKSYREILNHYFPNATVGTVGTP